MQRSMEGGKIHRERTFSADSVCAKHEGEKWVWSPGKSSTGPHLEREQGGKAVKIGMRDYRVSNPGKLRSKRAHFCYSPH